MWKRLRKKALEICGELGESSGVGYKYWAHHLPYGGNLWIDKFKPNISPWTRNLKEGLSQITREVETFPEHGWEHGVTEQRRKNYAE